MRRKKTYYGDVLHDITISQNEAQFLTALVNEFTENRCDRARGILSEQQLWQLANELQECTQVRLPKP